MAGGTLDGAECPDDGRLRELLDAREVAGEIEDHLEGCEACRGRLDELAGRDVIAVAEVRNGERSGALAAAMLSLKTQPVTSGVVDLSSWLEPAEDLDIMGMLGRYEVRGIIEEGGMGIVVEGWDVELEREVAIKLIKPVAGAGERVLREARAAAGVVHDAVVPIYAVESLGDGGLPFIVMPLVRGGSLQERMDSVGGALPLGEVVSVGRQVAEALGAAHERGLLHRDIKPANILMRGEGKVWVADFGLARGAEESRLTVDGQLSGTPQFMAPEQVEGREVDARADLFSLGSLLYEMATGRRAFAGESGLAVVRAVVDEEPVAASKVNGDVPGWLGELIGRLMQKDPEKRPSSAAAVVDVLASQGMEKARVNLLWPILVGIVVLLVGGAVLLKRDRGISDGGVWEEAAFSNLVQQRGYGSLAAAVAGASDGDVIVINQDGVVHSGSLALGKKRLTLMAGEGVEPELRSLPGAVPLIESEVALRVEGLQFISAGGSDSTVPMFRVGGPLVVTNCLWLRGRPVRSITETPAIEVVGAGPVLIRNSAILVLDGPGMGVGVGGEEARVELENCLVAGLSGVDVSAGKVEMVWRRSAFHGREFLTVESSGDEFPEVDLRSYGSVFETRRGVFLLDREHWDSVEDRPRFGGSDNLYKLGGGYVGLLGGGRNKREEISSLAEWRVLWGESETGAEECVMDLLKRVAKIPVGESSVALGLVPSAEAAEKFPERGVDREFGGVPTYQKFRSAPEYRGWDERVLGLMGGP